jgi:orotidine-5'-phosphate decarboxylase
MELSRMTFSDRLAEAVRRKGPLCVGIDPRWESLPAAYRTGRHLDDVPEMAELEHPLRAAAITGSFVTRVLELVEPYCGVVKPQAAFFELLGPAGTAALQGALADARELGLVTILDAKRGDIASTATAYADAAFAGCKLDGQTFPVWDADSLTINPYLGRDAVEPFLTAARAADRGTFVLVRTSNPGAGLFQDLVCDGKPLYRHVASAVVEWNAPTIGACGLGDVGAVVGATHPRELVELRAAMPDVWLLVPGYGAQGGTAADVRAAYRADGLGAVVNSSRGVTFPFHPDDPDWEAKVVAAAQKAQAELRG